MTETDDIGKLGGSAGSAGSGRNSGSCVAVVEVGGGLSLLVVLVLVQLEI